MVRLVAFNLDAQGYALPLCTVERVIRAIEITRLPRAPEIVLGVVSVHGAIIPVMNVRRRFRLPEGELNLSDVFILAKTPKRSLALVADAVGGVIERAEEDVVAAANILPGTQYLEGVAKLDGDLILIHDLERFLSLEEGATLDEVMAKAELG